MPNPYEAFLPSGKTGEYAKAGIWVAIAVLVIVLVVIIAKKVGGGIDGILEFLHLKDTPEVAAAKARVQSGIDTATSGTKNAWSPTFHNGCPDGTLLPNSAKASDICAQIWDSVGVFYDSPEQGLAAFKQLYNKAAVSWVVDMFNQKYQEDLLSWLKTKYDTTNQVEILGDIVTYVSNLPNYSS
jgi:hypothetical protein